MNSSGLEHGLRGLGGPHGSKRKRSNSFDCDDCTESQRQKNAASEIIDLLPMVNEPPPQTYTHGIDESKSSHVQSRHTESNLTVPTCTEAEDQCVCFGMVVGVSGACQFLRSPPTRGFRVHLDDSQSFHSIRNASIRGQIDLEFAHITDALLDEKDIELQVTCSVDIAKSSKSRFTAPISTPCRLNMVLFGPLRLFEEVGSFFEDHNLYLQDPVDCSRNVLYRNPHKLSVEYGPAVWTSDLTKDHSNSATIEETQTRPELIDVLNSQEDLVETPQPGSIQSVMKSHQLQALTFMLQREQGWAWDGSRADLWEFYPESTGSYFVNRVSNSVQTEAPQQFYGGIIADPMGLGKTLSMISLIATDLLVDRNDPSSVTGADAEESSGRTLIVVPPPLLDSWEEQLNQHAFPNSIPWRRHHGKSRLVTESDVEESLVVLTTYHTVSSEWRSKPDQLPSLLFSTRWRRIILDEAHFIRNSDSRMARSICSLDSVSRWAVTGTPIQNKLSDLTALLKFLQVYPYSEEHRFNTDISHLWKIGKVDEAVKRLKRLAGCILLRRPKTVIQLPPRHDFQRYVELASAERELYQTVKMRTISHIEQALSAGGKLGGTHSYANMLQRIEAMRMICNLGLYYRVRYDLEAYNEQASQNWIEAAQRMFNIRRGISSIQCRLCSCVADSIENALDEAGPPTMSLFSQCLEFVCSTCVSARTNSVVLKSCSHTIICPVATISTDIFETDDASNLTLNQLGAELPTKVSMLIDDLQNQPHDVKCIVFSSWRTTLEIIEVGLKQACIPCLRFDGKVAQKDRHAVIKQFRKDPTVRVLLVTLSCGAVGLTLTEASRAYLMEPHWNPTLEEQALARIHRIGQTKEVNTVRFIVKDSFEERVVELQKSKTDLAEVIHRQNESNQSDGTRRPLEWLKALI
ncbi:SNF2 family N-terminal domain-containing protein [Trichoderma ceciliae]